MAEKRQRRSPAPESIEDPRLYRGAEDDDEREARRELLERLKSIGVSEAQLLDAVEQERLAILPAELALGGAQELTLTDVAREVGIETRFLRRLLLALGRPSPARGERAFSRNDVHEAQILKALLDAGVSRGAIVQAARALGLAMANTAANVRELVSEALIGEEDDEYQLSLRYEQAAETLGPLLGPLLQQELLVHLRELLRRDAVVQAERDRPGARGGREIAVGFADLVKFTELGGELPPEALGEIADRLAELATAVAQPPVQLVKTIGDAVMLVSEDHEALVKALVELRATATREGEELPPLRIGAASGPAFNRGGDWFGQSVNLASRLTSIAKPGTINVSAELRERLDDDYDFSRRKRRSVKGVGRASYFRLGG